MGIIATLYMGGLRAAIQSFLAGGLVGCPERGLIAGLLLSAGSKGLRFVEGFCRVGSVVIAGR
jgi:hypothetical protein